MVKVDPGYFFIYSFLTTYPRVSDQDRLKSESAAHSKDAGCTLICNFDILVKQGFHNKIE